MSDEILIEYKDVLTRNKFKIDEDDIVFYEVALTGKKEKETYLITGNKKHFPVKSFVVTPREMMDIINGVEKKNN